MSNMSSPLNEVDRELLGEVPYGNETDASTVYENGGPGHGAHKDSQGTACTALNAAAGTLVKMSSSGDEAVADKVSQNMHTSPHAFSPFDHFPLIQPSHFAASRRCTSDDCPPTLLLSLIHFSSHISRSAAICLITPTQCPPHLNSRKPCKLRAHFRCSSIFLKGCECLDSSCFHVIFAFNAEDLLGLRTPLVQALVSGSFSHSQALRLHFLSKCPFYSQSSPAD